MMRSFTILVLLLGLTRPVPAGEPEQQPPITALPEFARIEEPGGTVLVLRGRLQKNRARRMARLARAVQQDLSRRFLGDRDKSSLPPVDVCLFKTTKAYTKFVEGIYGADHEHSDMGFYSPARRLVVANLGRSKGNLRHEVVHALLGDDFAELPAWLNEGFGSLYGTARRTRKGFRFLINYRLRHLRQARRAGLLPGLEGLAGSTSRDVYGPHSLTYYAVARYLLLYLEHRGKLDEFVRELRSRPMSAKWQTEVLLRYVDYGRFLSWTDKLDLP